MAFENSAASGASDLLQKLVIFLAANGWTTDLSASDGSGWRAHVHKGGQFVHLRACQNETSQFKSNQGVSGWGICLYAGTAYSSGNDWNDMRTGAPLQSGDATKPVGLACKLLNAAIANYYFFTDASGDNVAVVVQVGSQLYNHFGFGASLEKVGTYTGGQYFFAPFDGFQGLDQGATSRAGDCVHLSANAPGANATPFNTTSWFVRADVDAFTGKWVQGSDNVSDQFGYTGKLGGSPIGGETMFNLKTQFPSYFSSFGTVPGDFQSHQVSLQDGRANLLRAMLYAQRDGSGPGYSPLGSIPNIRVTSAYGQGFSAAEDYLLGADTWTIFPKFAVKKVV